MAPGTQVVPMGWKCPTCGLSLAGRLVTFSSGPVGELQAASPARPIGNSIRVIDIVASLASPPCDGVGPSPSASDVGSLGSDTSLQVRRQAPVKRDAPRIKPDGLCHGPGVSPCGTAPGTRAAGVPVAPNPSLPVALSPCDTVGSTAIRPAAPRGLSPVRRRRRGDRILLRGYGPAFARGRPQRHRRSLPG